VRQTFFVSPPTFPRASSKDWKRKLEIIHALENLTENFPSLGTFGADFSEPRKANREGAKTGRRLSQKPTQGTKQPSVVGGAFQPREKNRRKPRMNTDDTEKEKLHPQLSPLSNL
jgi:hypothetical protein